MARQVGGVRADSMANQMVKFPRSMIFPEPGQSFTIGSITWFIKANGNGEIMEAMQDNPALNMSTLITPALAPEAPIPVPRRVRRSIDQDDLITSVDRVTNGLAKCLSLMELVLNQSTNRDVTPALQGHHATNDEHPARVRLSRLQDEDLVITATPDGRIVQRRPLPAPTENMPRPYSFGLVGADLVYRHALHHLFTDHTKRSYVNDLYQIDLPKADQPTPTVNMVQIR